MNSIFTHIPHPHIHRRKQQAPLSAQELHQRDNAVGKFNSMLAIRITTAVGTMWCAYAFALLALVSLPAAVSAGTAALISWIAQTFLQLVLLSIIIVGQKVSGDAADKRAMDTYSDAEAILHEAVQLQQHLAAQDAVLMTLVDKLAGLRTSADAATSEG
jgi:hypothetical protein